MNSVLVSVIIPAYNAAKTICFALDSIKKQTHDSFEIIIINDGSTDDTELVVKDFFKSTSCRFPWKYITQANSGVANARNKGIEHASGEFVAFLDADDQWLAQKTSSQLALFSNQTVILIGGLTETDRNKTPDTGDDSKRYQKITLRHLIFKNYFQPSTVMIRKSILSKTGLFQSDRRYAEEGDFFMRIATMGDCLLLQEKVVDYGFGKRGFGDSGLSSKIHLMEKGELENIYRAWGRQDINIKIFCIATIYSLAKYLRRIVMCSLKFN